MLSKENNRSDRALAKREVSELDCSGFEGLEEWQIGQYRQGVDNCRREQSKALGRCVGWFEAERYFFENHFMELADQWRKDYCGLICPKKQKCLLALQLLKAECCEPMNRTG